MKGLEKANLPPSLSVPKGDAVTLTWQPGWIPAGMSLVSQNRRTLPGLNKNMESKLYSDGLFSFAINVTPADKTSTTQTLRTGRRTVQTVVRNNNEIAVIGELPPSTAKRIADSIDLGSQNDERMGHRGGMAGWHRHAAHRSKTSCNSCQARKGCGSHMLNKLGPKNAHVMQIASSKPLQPGQRIELGIKESSLLGSALLVYMTPLFGLFLVSGLFQALFSSDLAAACGALLGGIGVLLSPKAFQ